MILRNLPNDQYQAALQASAPSAANPFATLADVGGGSGSSVIFALNTDTSIYSDGDQGTISPNGEAGWYYTNPQTGSKINWYFYDRPQTAETVGDLTTGWFVARVFNAASLPFINVYTSRQFDGNDQGSWYRSRLTYTYQGPALTPTPVVGTEYFFYVGADPGYLPTVTNRVQLTKDLVSSQEPPGGTQPTENILTINLGTNSAAAAGDVEFNCKNFGYDTTTSHGYVLHAVSTGAVWYTRFEDNTLVTPINVPGQWEEIVSPVPTESPLNSGFFINGSGEIEAGPDTRGTIVIITTGTAFRGSGSGSDGYELTIFKNGAKIPDLKTGFRTQGGGSNLALESATLVYLDTVVPGDTYKVYVRSATTVDDIEVRNAQTLIFVKA
jgi:hypothetical protein